MSAPYWVRSARSERYRVSSQFEHAADAWQRLTGNTSASYGELVALAILGADVRIVVADSGHPTGRRVMRMGAGGGLTPEE